MKSTFRQHLLTSTLMIGAVAFASPAYAQTAPTDDDVQENAVQTQADATDNSELNENEEPGEIVVTGSRIQRRDLTSTSPLTVIQDEEFQLSGATNVEQVLNQLPQVIPGVTAFSNNPGGGVATLQLRGLGSTRSLVLVNGRRYIFFSPSQVVDLNTIPQFLIDSVDVVTGGASAVYGSDAIAGVVNFRLQTDLQGFQAGAQYSITEEGDGARYGAHLAVGAQIPDGRGHVVAFGEYYNRSPVFQGDRAFSRFTLSDACVVPGSTDPRTGVGLRAGSLNSTTGACTTGEPGFEPGGSTTTPNGTLRYFGRGRPVGNFNANGVFFEPGGVGRARVAAADVYNFAPSNYLQVPQERWLLGGYGEFEVSEGLRAFTEVTFVNNRVLNELAPTPVTGFFNLGVEQTCRFVSAADCTALRQLDVNETAANTAAGRANDPGVVNIFVQRRTNEVGPRVSFDERNAFRALAGFRGDLTEDLNFETYYFFARTRNSNVQEGNVSRRAFQAGLDGTAPAINIFGPNTLTPAAARQIAILAQNNTISNLQVASAAVSGNVFNLGFGAEDVGFAVGGEYRSVSSRFIPDVALSSGDVIGFNAGQPTQGGYDIREAFAEVRVPILGGGGFPHRLELTGAARRSDYSLQAVGGVWTYAAGAEFAPIRDITFRGQYQRAVRAPNVEELFGGQRIAFPGAIDPCSRPAAAADPAVRQICIATGVPAGLVGNASLQLNPQIPGTFGGNPNLEEERSDTYTVGAVIRPSFIPRLNIAIDAYDIQVDNVISVLGGGLANVLNLCFNVIRNPQSPFCQAVRRNPAGIISGEQFTVQVLNANIGRLATRGIDFQLDYSQPLGFSLVGGEESRLNFFFLGNYTDEYNITPVAELPERINRCAGRFGQLACPEPQPRYKWSSRLSFIDGPVTISPRWRHVGAVTDDDPDTVYTRERIGSYDVFDLAFAFDVTDAFRMSIGANNLLDRRPPILGNNAEQANTYPSTYDPLGRDFFVSANLRF
ncbi:MAG: TonB-dependent receptor [Pseudomonadota bacterium]|nr:TonB-dependent receptor [Pseudomonadota bacterium]